MFGLSSDLKRPLFRAEEDLLFLRLRIGQLLGGSLCCLKLLVPVSTTPEGVAKKSPDRQSYCDADHGAQDGGHW